MNRDLSQAALLGRYQILETIGKGGFGRIYHAYDTRIGREVAIKVIENTQEPEYLIRESRIIARLSHPNIVTIFDLQEDRNNVYMIMELNDGVSLQDIYDKDIRLTVPEAISIAYQLCNALEAAHKRGIVHMDIKPSNILINREGRVKVADFGISRIIGEHYREDENYILGTEEYMAPEILEGEKTDALCDIFSTGIVIYEMLTGDIPRFQPEDARYRSPSELNPSVPKKLDMLINSCISTHPSERLDDISQLREELENLMDSSISSIENELRSLVYSTARRDHRPTKTAKIHSKFDIKKIAAQFLRFYQPILRVFYSLISITPLIVSWIFFHQIPAQIFSAALIVIFFAAYFVPKFGLLIGSAAPLYLIFTFNLRLGVVYSILWVLTTALLIFDLNAGALVMISPLLWMGGVSFLPVILAAYLFEPALSITVAITGTLISEISLILFGTGALPNFIINWPNISAALSSATILSILKSVLDFIRINPLHAIQLIIFTLFPGLFSLIFKTNKKPLQILSLLGCIAFIGFMYFWFFDKFLEYSISMSHVIKNMTISTIIMIVIILIGGKVHKNEPPKEDRKQAGKTLQRNFPED